MLNTNSNTNRNDFRLLITYFDPTPSVVLEFPNARLAEVAYAALTSNSPSGELAGKHRVVERLYLLEPSTDRKPFDKFTI